jgi:hypothetical protein
LVLCFVLSIISYLLGENGNRLLGSLCAIAATLLAILAIFIHHFGAVIPNSIFGEEE